MVAECVDPAPWHAFAPEFQIASLAVMAARREGFDPAYAIDVVLALVARQLGKPVVSLETPEVQMAALRLPTRAATIEFVESSLDDLDDGRAGPLLARLIRAWTDGDLAELAELRPLVRMPAQRRRADGDEAPPRRPQPSARRGDRLAPRERPARLCRRSAACT